MCGSFNILEKKKKEKSASTAVTPLYVRQQLSMEIVTMAKNRDLQEQHLITASPGMC